MSKLITAGFKRLFRLKSFYGYLIFIAFELIVNMVSESGQIRTVNGFIEPFSVNPYITENAFVVIIMAAIVIGNFIGSEYSYGTMRNKLTVGHNRIEIYFANYIVSLAGVAIMLAFGVLLAFAVGLPLGAIVDDNLHIQLFLQLVFALVISALYVFVAMNVQSRSNTLTAAIILGVVMIIADVALVNQLSQPEFNIPKNLVFNEEGVMISEEVAGDPIPNPFYVGGTNRVIMEIADTLLPCAAVMEYGGRFEADKVIAELCETVIFTAAGLFMFRRVDLK